MDSFDLTAVKQRCRGVSFVAILLVTAFFCFVFFTPLFLLAFLVRLSCARFLVDTVVSTWFALAVAVYELVYGLKVVVRGDAHKIRKQATMLIVMNHRTRVDWLFYFAVQARYGSLRRFKISLKDMLRHAPGAGWAMQAAHFLFLKRNWESDQKRIKAFLKHFQTMNSCPQLLLFPEGTDLQPDSLQKSKNFAKKNDLPELKYVLHPRTTGFTSMFNLMKTYNNLEQVLDVTIAYPHNLCQDENDVISGNIPREVVFTVNCYDVTDVPSSSDSELVQWLGERWRIKEELLKNFYEGKDNKSSHSNGFTIEQNLEIERETKLVLLRALVFFTFISFACVCAIVYYSWFRWAFLILVVVNTFISSTLGFHGLFARLSQPNEELESRT